MRFLCLLLVALLSCCLATQALDDSTVPFHPSWCLRWSPSRNASLDEMSELYSDPQVLPSRAVRLSSVGSVAATLECPSPEHAFFQAHPSSQGKWNRFLRQRSFLPLERPSWHDRGYLRCARMEVAWRTKYQLALLGPWECQYFGISPRDEPWPSVAMKAILHCPSRNDLQFCRMLIKLRNVTLADSSSPPPMLLKSRAWNFLMSGLSLICSLIINFFVIVGALKTGKFIIRAVARSRDPRNSRPPTNKHHDTTSSRSHDGEMTHASLNGSSSSSFAKQQIKNTN